jgi:hypothetical protein
MESQNKTHNSWAGWIIAIIVLVALLTVLLFPFYFFHPNRPLQHICQSNEKQLGLAFLQYSQDNDMKVPPGNLGVPAAGQADCGVGWAGKLYSYTRSTDVYHCPDDPTGEATGQPNLYPVSYAYNSNFDPADQPIQIDNLNDPAVTVVLAEAQGQIADVTDCPENTSLSPAGNGESLSIEASGAVVTDPNPTYVTGTYRARLWRSCRRSSSV